MTYIHPAAVDSPALNNAKSPGVNRRNACIAMAATIASTAAPAAQPGVEDRRVLFGQTIGFDSVWGTLYRNYTEGLEARFRQANAEGGIHGRLLELTRLEDKYDTQTAVANVRALADRGDIFGLVCIGGTAITVAAMPVLQERGLPTVGTMTGATAARVPNGYLFHTRAGYADEIDKIVEHLSATGIKRIAVVHQDNLFGRSNLELTQAAATRRGAQVVAVVKHPTKDWDVAAIGASLAESNPQSVLLFSSPATVADLVRSYRKRYGLPLPTPWVLSVTSSHELFQALGSQVQGICMTQVMPHPMSGSSPLARQFRQLAAKHGRSLNASFEAIEGMVTAEVVIEALRRCGRNLTREGYVQALQSMRDVSVGELRLSYGPAKHAGSGYVSVTMLRSDGSFAV